MNTYRRKNPQYKHQNRYPQKRVAFSQIQPGEHKWKASANDQPYNNGFSASYVTLNVGLENFHAIVCEQYI